MEGWGGMQGGEGSGAPHTTSKRGSRHQYAPTRLVTPTGSADDGKRLGLSESTLNVVYRKVYLKGRESEGGVGSRSGRELGWRIF